MVTAPVLAFPRSDAEFIVDCDASDYGLRAIISQEQDGSERVTAYASRVLGQSWALIQHYQERDACYGLRIQTLPPLPVWKTV